MDNHASALASVSPLKCWATSDRAITDMPLAPTPCTHRRVRKLSSCAQKVSSRLLALNSKSEAIKTGLIPQAAPHLPHSNIGKAMPSRYTGSDKDARLGVVFSDWAMSGSAGKYIIMPSCAKRTAMQEMQVNKGRCRLGICVALDEVYGWRVRAEQMAYKGVGMLFACQYERTKLQNSIISSEGMSARRVMRIAD